MQEVNQQIETLLQQEIRQYILRPATRWHEFGEHNKYFFGVIKGRQSQQTVQTLRSSTAEELFTDTNDILREARSFYSSFYSPEDIDQGALNTLLSAIPSIVRLTEVDSSMLTETPVVDDLLELLKYSPIGKSPRQGGIPFEVYKYLFSKFPRLAKLFACVLSNAFAGIFPETWQHTRMVLLFKKSEPTLLSNWRPLLLINAN
ncbi:uncharacterized protein B0P05DRAFT_471492 [Gilbertella persicaria]|uniref:uncharacterized protein n=1 Tax=Gilbertella persicaria TaxID=101096 RepID=UPI002220AE22|nr:uncharacterized protein B0P05DRAFT_471492 [Gilbertella persicaria]KAI8077368.1 hypothetical protein B0P05DRAFT_471492 [Gilbertella persicaria]